MSIEGIWLAVIVEFITLMITAVLLVKRSGKAIDNQSNALGVFILGTLGALIIAAYAFLPK